MVPQHIKNLIFDFGAVVFDIDASKTIDAFKALHISEFDTFQQFLVAHSNQTLFLDIEKGSISAAQFRDTIREWSHSNVTNKDIDTAWNAMLIGYRKERLDLLKILKPKYRTFLLSNTNIIHWEHFTKMLHHFRYKGLHELFEKEYYSHMLGMRKPDTEIYEFVLQDAGIIAEETLFLDDNEKNVEAAQALGINAIRITGDVDILKVFERFL